MTQLHQLEFFVIRYVPDVVTGRFVNLGVVVFEGGPEGTGFADVKFIDDFAGVPMEDPETEVALLTEMEVGIRTRLFSLLDDCSKGGTAMSQREWILRVMEDSFSNTLQVSEAKAFAAVDPQLAMNELVRTYCEVPTRKLATGVSTRKQTGRRYLLTRMTRAFENGGLLDSLPTGLRDRPPTRMTRNFEAAGYTADGDKLKLDFTYSFSPTGGNSVRRFFHAVSLKSNPERAKMLAYSWPRLKDGLARVDQSEGMLTTVVEDDLRLNDKAVGFAMGIMKDNGIDVRHLATLPVLVGEARRELGL